MSERDRQADLDWLYGKGSSTPASPQPAARPRVAPPAHDPDAPDANAPKRPRITPPAYDITDEPEPPARPTPVPAPPPIQEPVYTPPPAQAYGYDQHYSQGASDYEDYPAPGEYDEPYEPERPRRRRRRHPFRAIFVLLLAWVTYLIGVPIYASTTMTTVPDAPLVASPAPAPGTAMLLVGTDSREHLSPEERDRLGTGDAGGSRADTIMMLYRPPKGRSVLISLPRDLYVSIPDYGNDKLNASYSYGGPQLLITTVEQATGVKIDGYMEIGFGGFSSLVDAVGGIEVCLEEPMSDEDAHIDLPAGCQTINGAQALGYVRMRHADPRGDLGRAERQREVIGKVASKVASPASVLNPIRYWKLNTAMASMVNRGEATSVFTLAFGGLGVLDIAKGDGLSFVVPIADPAAWSPEGASIVLWDEAACGELFAEINAGDTSQMDRFVG